MNIPVECCGTCSFSSREQRENTLVRVCRRYPPVADNSFIKVDGHSWCGEFNDGDIDVDDPEWTPFVLLV